MSDLHLTHDQIEELSEMGALGKYEANVLRLWRDATPGPWGISTDPELRERILIGNEDDIDLLEVLVDADTAEAEAIVYARNTAELKAALVYKTLKPFMSLCEEIAEFDETAEPLIKALESVE